ncbi:MAG: GNAT family N-acetyltransferase [Lachnospiraceae bacterium]|nr:GNAT family N-acetyltransferase [Lachnospiraceae bacterium]
MIRIEKMTEEMRTPVLEMVEEFYHSDAVCHPVPMEVLAQTFEDAVSPDPVLTGYVLKEADAIVGFAYVTLFYACEVGGRCLMLEELFIKEEARGKGYGTAFFKWVMESHPQVKRFRLEVTEENKKAIALYKSLGFEFLDYRQMVRDL